MGLHVAGRAADQHAVGLLGEQVARLPAGAAADAIRLFKRVQEVMRNERVGDMSSC